MTQKQTIVSNENSTLRDIVLVVSGSVNDGGGGGGGVGTWGV